MGIQDKYIVPKPELEIGVADIKGGFIGQTSTIHPYCYQYPQDLVFGVDISNGTYSNSDFGTEGTWSRGIRKIPEDSEYAINRLVSRRDGDEILTLRVLNFLESRGEIKERLSDVQEGSTLWSSFMNTYHSFGVENEKGCLDDMLDPQFRKLGMIGSGLILGALENIAKEAGCNDIVLFPRVVNQLNRDVFLQRGYTVSKFISYPNFG